MTDTNNLNQPKDLNQVEVLENIENLIKSHIAGIEKLKDENKKNKEMIDDVLTNDAVYKENSDKAKEATKVKTATRAQIMKQPNMMSLSQKLKEGKTQLREMNEALSEYLREYGRLTGSNEITGEDGEVREIIYTAKLIKRSSRIKI
jgi:hypothetical protein